MVHAKALILFLARNLQVYTHTFLCLLAPCWVFCCCCCFCGCGLC